MVVRADVERAAERIRGRLHRTPTLSARSLGPGIRLKAELLQCTGSFKTRGVLNNLATLTPEQREQGVIGISAGNHAQALAWGAAAEGVDALVVMWHGASETKIAATRGYGATVDLQATGPGDAFARLEALIAETGRTLVHPFDDPIVIAGQGTVALELLEDAPEVETILVPGGGGGLVSGVAAAAPDRRVICVEPEGSAGDPRGPGGRVLRPRHAGLDRGRALRAVRRRDRPGDPPRERRRVGPGLRGGDRGGVPLALRPGEARVRAGGRGGPRAAADRAGREGQDRCRGLGRQRGRRNGRCYPGASMKADIHPEYALTTVRCSCGNEFRTRSTKTDLHVEICSACHPFYTGKQKLMDTGGRVERFQRRLEKAGGASAAAGDRLGQHHRRTGRPRGRDDAQPVELGCRRPQAERRDRPGRQHIASPMARNRLFRLPGRSAA